MGIIIRLDRNSIFAKSCYASPGDSQKFLKFALSSKLTLVPKTGPIYIFWCLHPIVFNYLSNGCFKFFLAYLLHVKKAKGFSTFWDFPNLCVWLSTQTWRVTLIFQENCLSFKDNISFYYTSWLLKSRGLHWYKFPRQGHIYKRTMVNGLWGKWGEIKKGAAALRVLMNLTLSKHIIGHQN